MRCSLGCIGSLAANSDVQFLQAFYNKEISLRVTQISFVDSVNKARVNPLIQGSTLLLHKLGGGGHKLSSWLKARGVLSLNSAYMTELI